MTLAAASCIQYGIIPDMDRLIVPVRRERRPTRPLNGAERMQLEALRTRRTIIRLAPLGYPDKVIAAFVDRSAHQVYVIRKRSGMKRYRTDNYVREPRRIA